MKRLATLALISFAALSTACAIAPGPGVTGNGRYLQLLNDSQQVVAEYDVVAAGHRDCGNQAELYMKGNNRPGGARCSHVSQPGLNYGYIARARQSQEFLPSSPYNWRTFTSSLCKSMLAQTKATEDRVIVKDNCSM